MQVNGPDANEQERRRVLRATHALIDWDAIDRMFLFGKKARDCNDVELLAILSCVVKHAEIRAWDVSFPQPMKDYLWPDLA